MSQAPHRGVLARGCLLASTSLGPRLVLSPLPSARCHAHPCPLFPRPGVPVPVIGEWASGEGWLTVAGLAAAKQDEQCQGPLTTPITRPSRQARSLGVTHQDGAEDDGESDDAGPAPQLHEAKRSNPPTALCEVAH